MSTRNYHEYRKRKIIRYIDSIKNGFREFPPSLQVGLTDHCFNTCVTCGHWKRKMKQVLDRHDLLALLKLGKSKGLETVCYSGGDPFAYPAINEIMKWHIQNAIDFGFIASGFIPANVNNQLVTYAKWVRVSLDAYGQDLYSICRGGVDFNRVLESIRHMLDNGVHVELGITVHKLNWDKLMPILEFAADNHIKQIRFWIVRHEKEIGPPRHSVYSKFGGEYLVFADAEGLDTNIEDTLALIDGGGDEYKGYEFNRCYACLFQAFISPDGSVYPCCITAGDTEANHHIKPLGDIAKGIFPWRSVNDFSNRELPEICKTGCITRLITVNHFAEKHWNDKHFI